MATFCTLETTRLRVFICGEPSRTSGASTAVFAARAGCVEGEKLASNFYATLGVHLDDHAQRAVEVVVFLRGQAIQNLRRKGFVARSAATLQKKPSPDLRSNTACSRPKTSIFASRSVRFLSELRLE